MSAGAFILSKYPAVYLSTAIHPIRIQPETLALSLTVGGTATANTAPTGAVTNPISARVSSSKRSLGLRPFLVRFKFSGTPPTGYLANAVITLPILNPVLRAAVKTTIGTYLGAAIVVTGISPEVAN
jgi:hypothetical protein